MSDCTQNRRYRQASARTTGQQSISQKQKEHHKKIIACRSVLARFTWVDDTKKNNGKYQREQEKTRPCVRWFRSLGRTSPDAFTPISFYGSYCLVPKKLCQRGSVCTRDVEQLQNRAWVGMKTTGFKPMTTPSS